ncbi:MAG: putative (di)nucleoside polyphosphate hydrolase [Oceanicoccus sp.]|jgi:putative (di)nucleoside polyphosphate hydrolase
MEQWRSYYVSFVACRAVQKHIRPDSCCKRFREFRLIDSEGFRANVGIMLANAKGELLWARRIGQDAWQFPQGGINEGETAQQALFRELQEEVGLTEKDVEVIACTRGWLRYRLPQRLLRRDSKPLCIGQKQKWFLLRMLADDSEVSFDSEQKPEFDGWRWVSYWYPLRQVIPFKREVYRRALKELAPRHSRLVSDQLTASATQ